MVAGPIRARPVVSANARNKADHDGEGGQSAPTTVLTAAVSFARSASGIVKAGVR